ncbi:MAG: 4Fe-4S dicluster domain-containing protein [Chloroflexi bacterium]|nr:4Fe-4S dicluster domain-containing protein [Chloroflexota bacterium]
MAKHAVLVDLAKCIGCRGCQVACKQWQDLPSDKTRNLGSYQNPIKRNNRTFMLIEFHELEQGDKMNWIFAKRQCMHCATPSCVSACTVGALIQREDGPVVYDAERCIGCRYCQYACPFHVPMFEWNKQFSLIAKCNFCVDRLDAGEQPACAKTCPPGALKYGTREEMLEIANHRIYSNPGKYVKHVYGEHEVGGTSWLYISPVPFEQVGFPVLPDRSPVELNNQVIHLTPTVATGMALVLSGVYWTINRRRKVAALRAHTENDGEVHHG